MTVVEAPIPIEAAFDKDRARLIRILRARLHDDAVAADLVDEAFCRLVRAAKAGAMPHEPGAWLFRVACNLAVSWIRTQRRMVSGEAAMAHEPQLAHPDYALRESARDVLGTLALMGDEDRACVLLSAHGYTASEIGASLGWSPGATRTRLCRARKVLRTALATG